MKTFVFSLILAVSFGANAAEKIAFDGRDYFLSSTTAKQGEVVNHYRGRGDSFEKWEKALTVHLAKGKSTPDEAAAHYQSRVGDLLMEPITMRREGRSDDLVVVTFVTMPGGNSFEYSLQRFASVQKGVIGYRYAQRLPQGADLASVLAGQSALIDKLFALSAGVHEAR